MALITLSAVNAVSADSSVIYVNDSGGNDSWDGQYSQWQSGTLSGPKKSIGNATGTVSEGGTVQIANGLYTGTGNTNITIRKSMTITGQNKAKTIISGNDTNWIFKIVSNVNVTIQNLTMTNGNSTFGGAIYNNGTLTVSDSIFTNNKVTAFGGAISNYNGTISSLSGCAFTNNSAGFGGAIDNNYCTIGAVIDCNFTGNNAIYGGAVSNWEGNITTLSGGMFSNNTASRSGGAVSNYKGIITNLSNCNFTNNIAADVDYGDGGAVFNYGIITSLSGCNFIDNNATDNGGAIYNNGTINMHFNVLANNTATNGSAIYCSDGSVDADYNWWDSNNNPSGKISGFTVSKWLVLTLNTSSIWINNGKTSTLTADLLHDSDGVYHDPADGHVPDGTNISFKSDLGSVNPESVSTTNGMATTIFASNNLGLATVFATVGSQTVKTQITIGRNDVYVSNSGSDTDGDGSQSNPFKTIKTGILNVYSGGRLHIADGTYNGENNTNIIIDKDITIIGQSREGTIINGTDSAQIFQIQEGITVKVQSLTFANGNAAHGGAILNYGTLTVENSNFTGNNATYGGAILNLGNLTVINSYFTANNAISSGAISNSGTLNIRNTKFKGNTANNGGGAIENAGDLTVSGSDFTNNSAISGSVIYNTGNLTFNGGNIRDNTAIIGGGAVSNFGNMAVNGGNFTDNDGGAISNNGGNLTVNNSFFDANTAYQGGAIYNGGNLTVNSSFFYANFANDGSAIYNTGTLTAHFNVIAGNINSGFGYEIYNLGSPVDLNYNWWGYNNGPITSSIFDLYHSINLTTWLVLNVTASPDRINNVTTSTITADLTHDNNGVYHDPALEHVLDGIPVNFITDLGDVDGQSFTANGIAQAILHGGNVAGTANVSAGIANLYTSTPVTVDITPPTVNCIDPVNNTKTNVNNRTITITFNEPIQKGSAYDGISVTGPSGAIAITKEINGNTLTLTPDSNYVDGDYNVNIPVNAVADVEGNDLTVAFTSSFTVDTLPPTVTANSTGGLFNTTQIVLLTAHDNRDPSPIIYYTTDGKNWLQLDGSGTVLIYNTGKTNLEFYAVDDLENPSAHTVYTYTIDKTAPVVTATPTSGLSKSISVTLSSESNATIYYRINGGAWHTFTGTGKVSITSSGANKLEFYAVDRVGNPSAHTVYTYTIDKTAPKVDATSPKSNAAGVSRTAAVSIRLSENILKSVNWSKVYIKNLKTGAKCKASITISGNHIYITTSKKAAYTSYQVYIPGSAVKDIAGNNLAASYSFKFKTGKY